MNLPKVYEPEKYESDIYALWEKGDVFKPENRFGNKGTFSMVMPPPNANAPLHVGHCLFVTVEDIVTRYARMQGKAALWLPGADHAGFETWVVYEKRLEKEGKSRFDYSREELYQQVWDFVADNKETFFQQFRALGASCDWSRFTFTLDEKVVRTAFNTFKKLWDDGLIYRGERLVNYCTKHRTGFADIEVAYEDATTPLYYMQYGPFVVATTRPETKFGDTAVAVHPDDERYKDMVGKTVTVEGVNGPFEIMVIADEMVDMSFGTGVLKITPAHSFDDWEAAQRHNLPAVRVIDHDGTLNERAGRFRGMTVLEARKAIVAALKEKNMLIKVDEHYQNRMGKCYKCGTIIEPMLMEQWFVDMDRLAKPAIKALEEKRIAFHPESKRKQLIEYLQNLRDWNVSRQIAWGIPIPAFQNVDDADDWIYDERVDQEIIEVDGKTYHRDPDVFDTWFSSGQWPFVTTNYPDGDDFKKFYPTNLMETASDILYPWVSRMIMLGLYVTDEVPFKDVYLHGLVLGPDGQKMSKSKGNVVNPVEQLEKFGADALRLGLITNAVAGANQPYTDVKATGGRNFCNKLWNIARYCEEKIGDTKDLNREPNPQTMADHWILWKLQQSMQAICDALDTYRFGEAWDTVYHLVWDDFADWYIEASKAELNLSVLAYGLETILKLVHPFAPFVTETIWQTLAWEEGSFLATSQWPTPPKGSADEADAFEQLIGVVQETRALMVELNARGRTLYYKDAPLINDNAELIKRLAKVAAVKEVTDGQGVRLTQTRQQVWLDVDNDTLQRYGSLLQERLQETRSRIAQLEGRLGNNSYVDHAPKVLVEQSREQLADAQAALETISAQAQKYGITL
ncbi:MAG: valine--tRNA ligase [Candidatus Saccharibacteria bacterium]|nr:valine--tRNA ligase [Candidatus Saccharibacteria bacterium]